MRIREMSFGLCCAWLLALVAAGCSGQSAAEGKTGGAAPFSWFSAGTKVPAGTTIQVRLTSTVSSETAKQGDSWSGVVTRDVVVGEDVPIPAGSTVQGTVDKVRPAKKGTRAMLDLAMTGATTDGKHHRLDAATEPVIAGSPRARNLGAIVGGAAAGALIGKAVGGDNKDAAIGGIIGGAAAGGAVAASKGYQVVLKEGTTLTFQLNEQVAIR